tara:strand:+ start:304 stop:828 length:525 start_codon:yes stop_codon:yes gene_type:complete
MIISVHLVDFNKDNSSKSFLNDLIPSDEDKKLFREYHYQHEDQIETQEEDNDEFSYAELWLEHVSPFLEQSPSKEEFNQTLDECEIFTDPYNICLNKTNKKSFDFFFNSFFDWREFWGDPIWDLENKETHSTHNMIVFLDENLEQCDSIKIKELIDKRKKEGLPIIFSVLIYWA